LPELETVYQAYRDKGLLVLAISTSDNKSEVQAVVDEKKLTLPVLFADSLVLGSFGGGGTPETFVVDRGGAIIEHIKGAKGEAFFEERAKKITAAPGGK
jgi:peroxiredoxin